MSKGLTSLIDTSSLSEPVTKLIESVSNAIGILYEPTRIRRIAKAEVDAAIIQARGDLELQALALRASRRIEEVELRRQKNIETIVNMSIDQLPESVSSDAVDDDWIIQFFEYCKDVSNEQMQSIWARLLAGEVASPNKYSQRTMHAVKMLSPVDAQLFQVCTHYLSRSNNLYYSMVSTFLERHRALPQRLIDHLRDVGLFSPKLTNHIQQGETKTIVYFNKQFTISNRGNIESFNLGFYAYYTLTTVGEELLSLCERGIDEEFFGALHKGFQRIGLEVSKITDWNE